MFSSLKSLLLKPNSFRLVLISILSIVFFSCTPKIGEAPPQEKAMEFSITPCLSDAMPVFQKFVAAEASDAELNGAWTCLASALKQFKKYVVGRNQSQEYQPEEIAEFIKKNFLTNKDVTISSEFLNELMRLKQLFIGGKNNAISRTELDQVIQLVSEFKELSLEINPYMKILVLNWGVTENLERDVKEFEKANLAIQDIAKRFSKLIRPESIAYQINNFVNLLNQISSFYNEKWSFINKVERYLPLVKKLKKVLAGGSPDLVSQGEWESFSLLGARTYVQYLRYYYFVEKSNDSRKIAKLQYFIRSLNDALSIFESMIRSKSTSVVDASEVSELIRTSMQIWPELQLKESFVVDLMKFKRLLLGGNFNEITGDDISRAKSKITLLHYFFENYLINLDIFIGNWDHTQQSYSDSHEQFLDVEKNLLMNIDLLKGIFESEYSYEELLSLMDIVDSLYPPVKGEETFKQFAQRMRPLFNSVKNILFNYGKETIEKDQWFAFIKLGSLLYCNKLYYQYFISSESFDEESKYRSIVTGLSKVADSIEQVLTHRNKIGLNGISKAQINQLVVSLQFAKIIPQTVRYNSIDSFVNSVLNNFLLKSEDRLKGKRHENLEIQHVLELKKLVLELSGNLQFLYTLKVGKYKDHLFDVRSISNEIDKITSAQFTPLSIKWGINYDRQSLLDLKQVLLSPLPMIFDHQGKWTIQSPYTPFTNFNSLPRIEFSRMLAKLLISSFSEDFIRIQTRTGLNLEEVKIAYQNIRGLLEDLKIIDPNSENFAGSRFIEGNIFTPRGDGNQILSLTELFDLVGLIQSGISVDQQIKIDLLNKCLIPGKQETVSISCYLQSIDNNIKFYFSNLPHLIQYRNTLDGNTWHQFLMLVLKASGYKGDGINAKLMDISLVPHVLQYIEMNFTKNDKNRDGQVDDHELVIAFPPYKNLLKELAQGAVSDDELLPLFAYILKEGKPPESWTEKLYFKFMWTSYSEGSWDVHTDRFKMASILSYIADQIRNPSAVQRIDFLLKKWPETNELTYDQLKSFEMSGKKLQFKKLTPLKSN